jgi:peptidoglycan hydrolase-like protein with peptidoglycan-binding domain
MNQELGFETIPFELDPEIQSEIFEEESERGVRRPSAGGGSRYSRSRSQPGLRPKGTKRPPVPKPRPIPRGPRRPWGIIREPYSLVSEPYPGEPEPSGSERVRWIQDSLNRILGLRLLVNGIMGPETRSAVRSFQKQKGLPVTGIVGPDTEKALLDAQHPADAAAPPAEPAPDQGEIYEFETLELESPQSMPTLRRGSRGPAIADLQRRLAAAGFSPGAADGDFGSLTDAAVKSFQRSRGITADGIVGSQTWGQLYVQPGTQPSPIPSPSTNRWVLPADVRAAGEAQSVRYDSPPAWEDGRNCTGPFTQGAAELRQHILANFLGVTGIGGYNCRYNSGNPQQTSVHGIGRALDIMIPTVGGRANSAVGDPIANWLILNASAIGIQYIIWNRVSWGGNRRAPKDRSYTGPSPHIDHIHAELNKDGAQRKTAWFRRSQIGVGQPSTSRPTPAPRPSVGEPQVTISSNARVSENAVRVLKDILRAAGLSRATITSGRRTANDQARIMYDLIVQRGVSYAKNLYGSTGDKVIDVYSTQKSAGKSATAIKQAMESKINELGCYNVSHHCSDTHDVIDVAPSSIADQTAFRLALDTALKKGTIAKYIPPPGDPAFHIEIILSPATNELMSQILQSPPLPLDAFLPSGARFEMN